MPIVQQAARDPWPALTALGHHGPEPWRRATVSLALVVDSAAMRQCMRLRQPALRRLQPWLILLQHLELPPLRSMQLLALPAMSALPVPARPRLLARLMSLDIAAQRATIVTAPLSQGLPRATSERCNQQSRAPRAHPVQQEASVALEERRRQSPAQQVPTARRAQHVQHCAQLAPSEQRAEARRSRAALLVALASIVSFQEAAQSPVLANQASSVALAQPLRLLGPSSGALKFQPPSILRQAHRYQPPREQLFLARRRSSMGSVLLGITAPKALLYLRLVLLDLTTQLLVPLSASCVTQADTVVFSGSQQLVLAALPVTIASLGPNHPLLPRMSAAGLVQLDSTALRALLSLLPAQMAPGLLPQLKALALLVQVASLAEEG